MYIGTYMYLCMLLWLLLLWLLLLCEPSAHELRNSCAVVEAVLHAAASDTSALIVFVKSCMVRMKSLLEWADWMADRHSHA